MLRYAIRRIVFFVPVLFITSLITFFAINLVPVDPAVIFLGQEALPEQIEASTRSTVLTRRSCSATSNGSAASCRGIRGRRSSVA